MISIQFTSNFQVIFPQSQVEVEATTVLDALKALDQFQPGLSKYFLEDNLKIRKHVNVFVNSQMWDADQDLNHEISPGSKIHIMQALSGG